MKEGGENHEAEDGPAGNHEPEDGAAEGGGGEKHALATRDQVFSTLLEEVNSFDRQYDEAPTRKASHGFAMAATALAVLMATGDPMHWIIISAVCIVLLDQLWYLWRRRAYEQRRQQVFQRQGTMQDAIAQRLPPPGTVVAVCLSAEHGVGKRPRDVIHLIEGRGVEGDAHMGETVQHRSRVRQDPTQPNLRQVHLIHSELFTDLAEAGFDVRPGDMGENITTEGVDLLGLPTGALARLGEAAVVEVTGLRNPCSQLDGIAPGLMAATLDRGPAGQVVRKAGVMAVVRTGGVVRAGDPIRVTLPSEPYRPLERV